MTLTGLVLDNISNDLPMQDLRNAAIETPSGIELADPKFEHSRPIDLLLGAVVFFSLISAGQCQLGTNQPLFQKTLLGWVATGNLKLNSTDHSKMNCNLIQNIQNNKQPRNLWKREHGDLDSKKSNDELNTVTSGTASASLLATHCLEQIAMDREQQYPVASRAIHRDFYANNSLSGAGVIKKSAK